MKNTSIAQTPLFEKPPSMLLYSLLYAAVMFALSFAVGLVINATGGSRPGFLAFIIVPAAAWLACYVFGSRHKRHLARGEFWRLVFASCCWQLVFEVLAMAQHISQTGRPLDRGAFMFGISFAVLADFGIVYLSYRLVGRRAISRLLMSAAA